jgi:hypothetical protein
MLYTVILWTFSMVWTQYLSYGSGAFGGCNSCMFEPSRLDSDKNKRIQWQKTDLHSKHNTEYDTYNADNFLPHTVLLKES